MLNILVDENIAMAEEVFSSLGNVTLLSGSEITNKTVKNNDALIVRSVTKINKDLLENTNVKFVGSATIGVDHLDRKYLNEKNICYCNAPGSNSYSVAEYVITVLLNLAVKYDFRLKDKSIGIIGVGNIGSKVVDFAKAFGMNVLLNDPPLKILTNDKKYLPLKEVLDADILTLHVPYTKEGKHKTHHLFDIDTLKNLKEGTILINTARGSVIDNSALTEVLKTKKLITVLDVWENEPDINLRLLKQVEIGTPHIAGYSLDGKINGTKLIYKQLCTYLNKKPIYDFKTPSTNPNELILELNDTLEKTLLSIINSIYNINDDYNSLLKMLESGNNIFYDLRKNYNLRREFFNYVIFVNSKYKAEKEILDKFRFNVKTT